MPTLRIPLVVVLAVALPVALSLAAGCDSGEPGTAAPASAGSAGAAGSGGGASGTAGGSGSAAAGASGSGGTGLGGAAGSPAACKADVDCKGTLPATQPANCARFSCATDGTCRLVSVDADGDGHATDTCTSLDPSAPVAVGGDCNDASKDTFPGAWDGPGDATHPARCNDGVDQNCSGADGDNQLPNGATCTCIPGDVATCLEDSSGKTIPFPGGAPKGECKPGSKTCTASGTWGPCTGALAPTTETCDALDNDCDGTADEGTPADAPYWRYDFDGDLHGALGYAFVQACQAPTVSPAECATCPGVDDKGKSVWRTNIAGDDCDDCKAAVNPQAVEKCDSIDNNCDTQIDEECKCTDGAEQACGSSATCNLGKQTCVAGGWGPCTGGNAVQQITYCPDADNDLYCDLAACKDACPPTYPGALAPPYRPRNDCKGIGNPKAGTDCNEKNGSINPGQPELCNGIDDNCSSGVDDGYNVGVSCDVNGNTLGLCKGGGTTTCSGTSTAVCKKNNANIGQESFQYQKLAGGWDYNCSGKIEVEHPVDTTGGPAQLEGTCYLANGTTYEKCSALSGDVFERATVVFASGPEDTCGKGAAVGRTRLKQIFCNWQVSDKKCVYSTFQYVDQGCK